MVLVALAAGPALAQYAPGMDGRANDANNQVGSGGVNAATPQGFYNPAGLIVTGNVTGGRAFQGYSPIRDTSSLFFSAPSAGIGGFQRDSVGLGQVMGQPYGFQPNPFYMPSQTVVGIPGIQAGLNTPGGSLPLSSYVIPQALPSTTFAPPAMSTWPEAHPSQSVVPNSSIYNLNNFPLSADQTGRLADDQVTNLLRSSPLFGRTVINTRPLSAIDQSPGASLADPYSFSGGTFLRQAADPLRRSPRSVDLSDAAPSAEHMLGESRNLVSPTAIAPRLFKDDLASPVRDPLTGRPLPDAPSHLATPDSVIIDPVSGLPVERGAAAARDTLAGTAGTIAAPDGTGGTFPMTPDFAEEEDEFAELHEAVELLRSARDPGAAEAPQQYDEAARIVHGFTEKSVRSLVGEKKSEVGRLILQAEEFTRQGDYYKAGNIYNLAIAYEPDNAMLRFGYGHALLAAGEYLSAALQLTAGIERYPAIAYLKFDLTSFAPDKNVFDIRRADLEQRLERKEDYRLRFLLGYTEYYSGLKKFGLPNLEKAASLAPPDSVIARFPEMLKLPDSIVIE